MTLPYRAFNFQCFKKEVLSLLWKYTFVVADDHIGQQ